MMSRGSRVGSSASRPSSTSRSTSTCRAGPWQACTCTLWSPAARVRLAGSTMALAARSSCSQESRLRAVSARRELAQSVLDDARASLLNHRVSTTGCSVRCSSRTSRPSEASSGWPTRSWETSSTRGTAPRRSVSAVPQRGGGVRQPEVHVAVLPERAEQLDLGDRDPGVPEEREPRRQVDLLGAVAQRGEHLEVTSMGRGHADPGDEQPPQLGLPEQVGVEGVTGAVGVAAGLPLAEQGRVAARRTTRTGAPAAGPRRSDARAAAHPPRRSGRGRGAGSARGTTPGRRARRPPRAAARPARPATTGRPRGCRPADDQLGDDAGRRPELHARADTVLATLAVTEPVGEPLAEPALDAARRHQHELLRERVGQRSGEQPGQAVDEVVRARGAVEQEWHRGQTLDRAADRPHARPTMPVNDSRRKHGRDGRAAQWGPGLPFQGEPQHCCPHGPPGPGLGVAIMTMTSEPQGNPLFRKKNIDQMISSTKESDGLAAHHGRVPADDVRRRGHHRHRHLLRAGRDRAGRRPGGAHLVHLRRHRRRPDRALLRRGRLDHPGVGLGVLLRDGGARGAAGVHRGLVPDPRVRRRRVRPPRWAGRSTSTSCCRTSSTSTCRTP